MSSLKDPHRQERLFRIRRYTCAHVIRTLRKLALHMHLKIHELLSHAREPTQELIYIWDCEKIILKPNYLLVKYLALQAMPSSPSPSRD
jgi:hypothetical protein